MQLLIDSDATKDAKHELSSILIDKFHLVHGHPKGDLARDKQCFICKNCAVKDAVQELQCGAVEVSLGEQPSTYESSVKIVTMTQTFQFA